MTALENETISELRVNPSLLTTVLFHFHYFYVLFTFKRALISNGRPGGKSLVPVSKHRAMKAYVDINLEPHTHTELEPRRR